MDENYKILFENQFAMLFNQNIVKEDYSEKLISVTLKRISHLNDSVN